MSYMLIQGDARRIPLPAESVHCVVTSPPYFGLRDYGVNGQIGLEATPGDFVATMVDVFRDVWRVLRNDGTAWLVLGDSYANDTKWGGNGGNPTTKNYTSGLGGCVGQKAKRSTGLKPKDLMGIPWRVALALQDDRWYLRSGIVWEKPNAMPEPVKDRPSVSHEYVFLLTKSKRYFFDNQAISEPSVSKHPSGNGYKRPELLSYLDGSGARGNDVPWKPKESRNPRTVWRINTRSYKEAHFATYPPELAYRCVRAGASERGCCSSCGTNWKRVVEKNRVATRPGRDSKIHRHSGDSSVVGNRDPLRHVTTTTTVGWEAGCQCDSSDPVPCTILDPFNGAATTGLVAIAHGCRYVGIDLNPEYLAMSQRRLERPHAPLPRASVAVGNDQPSFLFGD